PRRKAPICARSPPNAPFMGLFRYFSPTTTQQDHAAERRLDRGMGFSLAPRQKDEVRKARPAANYSRFYIWKLKRLDGHINSC
ncbi:hypothetical protein, partial [Serratia nevei]